MLELDEMRQKWAEQDRKIEENIRLNRRLLSAGSLSGARSALQRMKFFLGFGAVVWIVMIVFLGNFIYENVGVLRLALPGIAADIYAIAMLAATVGQIAALQRIDYGKPVAIIQKELGKLRVMRIRIAQWGLAGGVVVWAPFLIVASKVCFGFENFSAAWLVVNVIFGLSLIPLAIWLSKEFGDRMGKHPVVQQLMRDIAGHNLNAATAFLATISEFEAD